MGDAGNDSGDLAHEKQRELEAEYDFHNPTPTPDELPLKDHLVALVNFFLANKTTPAPITAKNSQIVEAESQILVYVDKQKKIEREIGRLEEALKHAKPIKKVSQNETEALTNSKVEEQNRESH